jgi:hypothetical protein
MPKRIKAMNKKQKPRRRHRKRGEQLPGDGTTFTLEVPLPKSRLNFESKVFNLLQSITSQGAFVTSTSNPTFTTLPISLSNFDSATALSNVFDQYRIMALEVWIQPTTSAAVSNNSGLLSSVIDLDDATSLTSFNSAGDYPNCVTTNSHVGHYRHYKPSVADALYNGAFSGFGNVRSPWIDCGSPSVNHYGLKLASTILVGAPETYDALIRAHFQFRNVR